MNSVSARSVRYVRSIVDQKPARTAARNRRSTRGEFVEHTRRQILFAKLDQVNARGDRRGDKFEEAREVFS